MYYISFTFSLWGVAVLVDIYRLDMPLIKFLSAAVLFDLDHLVMSSSLSSKALSLHLSFTFFSTALLHSLFIPSQYVCQQAAAEPSIHTFKQTRIYLRAPELKRKELFSLLSSGTVANPHTHTNIWMEPRKQSAAHLQEGLQGENRILMFG